jgi:hypothetical protein
MHAPTVEFFKSILKREVTMENKLCDKFRCKDSNSKCELAYNGVCSAMGFDAHKMCGCEACKHHRWVGDEEQCTLENN